MRSLSISCAFVLCAGLAMAQANVGTITGTVADPAGAVVAGAPVQAKNSGTGLVYSGAASATGNYTISQLPVGTYEITVSASGFKKEVRPGVEVTSANTVRVDFALQVGTATESVTITAEAPLLKTESGELSHNVTVDALDSLPILTIGSDGAGVRNPLASIELLPGAKFSSDSTLMINGLPSSSQSIRIEGQDATNGFWKQLNSGNQTGTDAIQEVNVETSNYAAEFGQAGGGYINYTMKSGTNQYHGTGFDYFQNDALNAGLYDSNAGLTNSLKDGQLIRNRLRQNDFGGTFGGPLKLGKLYNGTNKTFFFFSYEQFVKQTLNSSGLATVPTPAYQQGNFGTALGPTLTSGTTFQSVTDGLGNKLVANEIFDPLSQQTVNGQVLRTPFAGNVIPVGQLDPTALKIQALLPAANAANPNLLVNNYAVPSYRNHNYTFLPTMKLDHNLNSSIKLSFFYSANRETSPGNNGYTQVFSGAAPTNQTSQTTRLNYDQTITPTLLMHVGAGLLQTTSYNVPTETYNTTQLFGSNTFPLPNLFPAITPGSDGTFGGSSIGMGAGFGALWQKDTKPTFTTSFTWVKGNHTFKFGGEAIIEGLPIANYTRANGTIGFGQAETGDPYWTGQSFINGATGFAYASFLMGAYNSMNVSGYDVARIGNHSLGFYGQDSWKVTRKLTIDYGIRYDYATLLAEEHGRMQDAAFNLPDTAIGGRNGTVIYGGDCGQYKACPLNHDYPDAFGPRLGIAYQINKKTVLRIGAGLSYGTSPNNAYLSYSVPDFYTFSDQPTAGVAAGHPLKYGNPFSATNPFGATPITYPNFTPQYPFQQSAGYVPPESPFISIDRNAGRLPRIFQWSVGLQREVIPGLVVEADYVGNRGAWFTAPLLSTYAYNALTPQMVAAAGLNPANPNDLALLNTPISSPLVQQRFPNLQLVPNAAGTLTVPSVYPGFPATQNLGQTLRPEPQWNGIPPFLGPPLGDTWYDALQMKVTKRFSHGLSANYAFTWQKELIDGASNDTSYLVSAYPRINDVFNYRQNKELNPFSQPLVSVISANYTTPKLHGDSKGVKAFSWLVRDWTYGALLTYASGQLLQVPESNNNFLSELQRGGSNNPALWGGGSTYYNMVPGQPLFLVNPNSHFDPTTTLALNPKAWQDAAPGQFGVSAPFYNSYRWQRQPQESMNFGRIFPLRKENRVTLAIRFEMYNVFNRVFYSNPGMGFLTFLTDNPGFPTFHGNPYSSGASGALSSGFGYVPSLNGGGDQPRYGQIVARITW